tara:strand:- start:4220 stop:5299 length:1080 start_codon:yes stop_codon:yes gene_type:complete
MSYNILGINPFHNGSACVLSDGEIVYFLEEERLSKLKHDANPFRVILDILSKFKIDEVIIAGINLENVFLSYTSECPFQALIRKFYPNLPIKDYSHHHHLAHLAHTYHNSGFKRGLGVIIDGGGSHYSIVGAETTSVYKINTSGFKVLHKDYFPPSLPNDILSINVASSYSCISEHLGFNRNEEGKTMGLSSYGKFNNSIPPLFLKNFTSNKKILYGSIDNKGSKTNHFNLFSPKIQNSLKSTFTQEEKDLAWKIQYDSQQSVGDLIEKYITETKIKQVCCAGGYFLNCVANYYLTKRFPDVEFYFEPISSDAGTAMGAAQLAWYEKTQNTLTHPQKTLYYGPKYSKKSLLKGIQKYLD